MQGEIAAIFQWAEKEVRIMPVLAESKGKQSSPCSPV